MARKATRGAKTPANVGGLARYAAALDKHSKALDDHTKAMTAAAGAQRALTAALTKNTAAVLAGHSSMQKIEDVEGRISQWLQQNKGVSAVDARTFTKKVSDFHISQPVNMEMFLLGVAKLLKDEDHYTYTPPRPGPDWNQLIDKLLNGTLEGVVRFLARNIS
ncbi:MAG TPA: hypothetical protein VLX44_06625 [Xanthobacteraceae bacterium]|nr:hypothetical protein [Xanthobacteraceae bacterium]